MNVTAYTLLINVATNEYPIRLNQVRNEHSNVSFAAEPSEEFVSSLGYAVVNLTDQPAGDVVTEGVPQLVNGSFQQTWNVRDFTAEELAFQLANRKMTLATQVDIMREAAMAQGFTFDFGGENGTMGVQLRDQDKTNLVALRVIAADYIAAGMGSQTMVFRTRENVNLQITATMMIAMTNEALFNVNAIYAASWVYKDQIAAATTLAELPTLPDILSFA